MVNNRLNTTTSRYTSISNQLGSFCLNVFTYSTVRSATIKSLKVGIVYRIAQILLLFYIVGWELIHNKGYQKNERVSSVVTTKVKGQGFVPINRSINRKGNFADPDYFTDFFTLKKDINYKLLDTADYVIPPSEYNSIFIMTNFIKTEQKQSICDEEYWKYKAICNTDEDCSQPGNFVNTWNGIPTGKCIQSSIRSDLKVCEIKAWCPGEHDNERYEDNVVRNVLNYTIFIKNDIEFKMFHKKQRNILRNITNTYISRCTYHDLKDPYCPVFQVGYILDKAEPNQTEKYLMLIKGGVVIIEIIWNCDFDLYSRCLPKYFFKRFDLPFGETSTASGFNFRFANRFRKSNVEYRELYKAFGLRFIINVSGIGGKFNLVPLMMTIGAGLGLMSISVLIADCVMLHCTKERKYFQKVKELDLNFVDTNHNNNNNNHSITARI
ncbi:unnamed protein product [Brachionus calyciflorus]|uniref:Purinergic receptor n=1 Tax=Brachionus calyciflorus TaxID=104777 RepID=A0A814KYE2_9BILA|nr:unnamed protein product [Brachionus calyciflorus]